MTSRPAGPLRIGCVQYLNTLPLIEGLEASRDVQLTRAVPSALGGMLSTGQVDVALVSLVDAVRATPAHGLIPVGGIGCDGATLTVRVFSQVPLDKVTTLHADIESHTSVILAQIVLARQFGVRVKVQPLDASTLHHDDAQCPWPETLLLIGDKVVTDSPPAVRYPHQIDLGEAWKTLTGLPFVYAMWMCRGPDVGEAWVRDAAALLERTRLRNTMRTQWLIDLAVDQRRWPRDLAAKYVTHNLRYSIGAEQRAGVGRFFDEAQGLGLLGAMRPAWVGVGVGVGVGGGVGV
ncbi:MAG: menaquinone biosynthesis protein [Phycisphaerales bacterium]|nr:menaquinone biosynthesis protein [Phycisphaerales bacterium]